jgi:L-ascorbate metabolism protein UlaG (beta-lactamase superfamily)
MKIKWLGHAAFLITSNANIRIITDPYQPGGGIKYSPITEEADYVTISHEHSDHNYVDSIRGNPVIIRGVGTHQKEHFTFKGFASFHDDRNGKLRGENTIFCFDIDDIKICHLGDLGHLLSADKIEEIGEVDVLLTPVGGTYTIDADRATKLYKNINPKVIIPMHFKTPKLDFPISDVKPFIFGKENVKELDSSEIEITKEELPVTAEIIVLKAAK